MALPVPVSNGMNILNVGKKDEAKILRAKAKTFDFSKFSKSEIRELVKTMRQIMQTASGIGLAANQIGLKTSMFVAKPPDGKFYTIFNPTIVKTEGKKILMEEGCLSVIGIYGVVPRYEKVTITGQDQNGKPIKIKAWGVLAHIFQHETDHLNGILYIDKAKSTHVSPKTERLQAREETENNQ